MIRYISIHLMNIDKMQDFKNHNAQKVDYDVLEISDEDSIKESSENPKDNRKMVILNDLVDACDKVQHKIPNHFTDGRHYSISSVYLSQSSYDVPQKLKNSLIFHL